MPFLTCPLGIGGCKYNKTRAHGRAHGGACINASTPVGSQLPRHLPHPAPAKPAQGGAPSAKVRPKHFHFPKNSTHKKEKSCNNNKTNSGNCPDVDIAHRGVDYEGTSPLVHPGALMAYSVN